MEDNKQYIQFNIAEIKTEQFALFEENYSENAKINLETNLSYGINKEERFFLISIKFTFLIKKKPFITIQVNCSFEIEEKSFDKFNKGNELVLPRSLVSHMSMITIGTTRGVLHSKTEGTIFNKYILPTINVDEMISEDVVFN